MCMWCSEKRNVESQGQNGIMATHCLKDVVKRQTYEKFYGGKAYTTFTFYPLLGVQFIGTKYVHIVVHLLPTSISRCF